MSRDESIDALRGLAITLVVAGHAILAAAAVFHDGPGLVNEGHYWVPLSTATNVVFNLIYSFHMPLFAFVSGLVLWPPRDRPLRQQILRRVRGLLIPYIAWVGVLYVVSLWTTESGAGRFGAVFIDAVVGRGGLWFLYALFICSVVLSCLAKAPGSRWLLPASALVAIVLLSGLVVDTVPNVLHLTGALRIYPFVVLGYMVGPFKFWVADHRRVIVIASLAAFFPLFYLRHPLQIRDLQPITALAVKLHEAGIPGGFALTLSLSWLCAAAAIFVLFGLYVGRGGILIAAQAWLGRKSLGIYAAHGAILDTLIHLKVRNAPVLFALSLSASVGLTVLLERAPLVGPVLLGQRAPVRTVASAAHPTGESSGWVRRNGRM